MIAVDVFCGAGGLTKGLIDAGIDVRLGIDIDRTLAETYERNNPTAKFMCANVSTLSGETLLERAGVSDPNDLLLAGCAPCQSFSKQRRGRFQTPERTLLGAFGRLVAEIRPGWILIENVPGITEVPGFSTYRRFVRLLRALGYRFQQGVLNAAMYGVPQHRRRFILIASQHCTPTLPRPNIREGKVVIETVRKWISHLPPIAAGESHPSVPNHVAARLSELNLRRIRATPHDGGDRRSWPRELQLSCHVQAGTKSYSDVYGRMWWDRVAPTLTGRCTSLSNGRFGHPEQDRAISLREAASLQTFPEDYVFFGPRTRISQWIGNAVPVAFARALGRHILELTVQQ